MWTCALDDRHLRDHRRSALDPVVKYVIGQEVLNFDAFAVIPSCYLPGAFPLRDTQETSILAVANAHKIDMASPCSRQLMRARFSAPTHRHVHARVSVPSRTFSFTRVTCGKQNFHRKESFRSRLNSALKNTKIKWEPIPIALGIGFLGAFQLYRIQRREKHTQAEGGNGDEGALDSQGRPKKRERIRPSGPWTVQVMSTLPLKALSRVWGRFNEIDIPYYFRVPGFKLYSWIFGVK
jgi:phosphatidylserine decarboxylase